MTRVAPDAYVVTHAYPWEANSLIVAVSETDLIMVDTPYTPEATSIVLDWMEQRFGERRITAINTGYHFDNLGGNQALVDRGIRVYGSDRTVELVAERGESTRRLFLDWLAGGQFSPIRRRYERLEYCLPTNVFPLSALTELEVAGERLEIIFPGETHAPDNVAVYFPVRDLLFAGCMAVVGSRLGNTADANMEMWGAAVESLLALHALLVIPGHGMRFDSGVLEHTIELLRER